MGCSIKSTYLYFNCLLPVQHYTKSSSAIFGSILWRKSYSSVAVSQGLLNKISNASLFSKELSQVTENERQPSVTKILKATQSAQSIWVLQRWKEKKIEEMGEEKFNEYATGLLRKGHAIHAAIHSYLLGEKAEPDEEAKPYMASISSEIDNFHDVQACEMHLTHNSLPYCGVVDCVAQYNSTGLLLVDWKTSTHKKTRIQQTFDHPLQLAAYVGLWNSVHQHKQVSRAMLVMMYSDCSPCDVIMVNDVSLKMYWEQWKCRLRQYWQQKYDSIATY